MEIIVFILFGLIATICLIIAGMAIKDKEHSSVAMLFIFSIICLTGFTALSSAIFGVGNLKDDGDLRSNQIYETGGYFQMANGNYAIEIKDQDNNIKYYELEKIPPKVFKVKKIELTDGTKTILEPYPSPFGSENNSNSSYLNLKASRYCEVFYF